MSKFLDSLMLGVLIVMGVILGYNYGKAHPPRQTVVEIRDTVVIRDTVIHETPVPYEVQVVDSIFVETHSVVYRTVNDTVYLALPMERKVYKNKDYELAINGYGPRLEYVKVFPETKYVTVEKQMVEKTKPRFSVGIQAGYGVSSMGPVPYIGIGGQFNLFSFK